MVEAKYHPTSLVPSSIVTSTFSPFATPTRCGSGSGARGAGKASRSWKRHARITSTTYASASPSAIRRASIAKNNVGAQHAAPLRGAIIARDALTANLSSRDDPPHLSLVPRGDPVGLGVLPRLRRAVSHRHHERACRDGGAGGGARG